MKRKGKMRVLQKRKTRHRSGAWESELELVGGVSTSCRNVTHHLGR